MVKRPRILLITRNLPPLVGGMERLNWHMADELAKQAEVKVIGPWGAATLRPKSVTLTEAPLKPLPLFLAASLFWGLWITLRWKPDIILAGSGLTAPIAWSLSKLCGARSVAYLHGLDIIVNHSLYRRLWRPTFSKLDRVVVNSTPTKALAITAGVNPSNIDIVYPGVSLPNAPQPTESIAEFRERYGLTGKKVLLSVGRLTARKGLREFVELSLPTIVQAEPDAMLLVIGETPKNSLAPGIQSVESIQKQAEKSGVAGYIKFLGAINDKTLATAYNAATLHVFPVRHIPDDPEGFGMVAIEAAAHGLPTVAFAMGGVVDAVAQGQSGYLVHPGDYLAFSEAVTRILADGSYAWQTSSYTFATQFAWPQLGKKMRKIMQIREETKSAINGNE